MGGEEALAVLGEVFQADFTSLQAGEPVAVVHGNVDFSFARPEENIFLFLGYIDLPGLADLWLQKALQLNLAYRAEHEESLSWDEEKHKLCLSLRLLLHESTEDTFYRHLESFIAQLGFWAKMASSPPMAGLPSLFSDRS
ncbi:MAG: CesT family type III secretion system chaperone [Puniceicoccales bacterium]|nr:CesT family type III secretion system chaperone [Puniceicoccales bacterium]